MKNMALAGVYDNDHFVLCLIGIEKGGEIIETHHSL